jgi:hypothetical protein
LILAGPRSTFRPGLFVMLFLLFIEITGCMSR